MIVQAECATWVQVFENGPSIHERKYNSQPSFETIVSDLKAQLRTDRLGKLEDMDG